MDDVWDKLFNHWDKHIFDQGFCSIQAPVGWSTDLLYGYCMNEACEEDALETQKGSRGTSMYSTRPCASRPRLLLSGEEGSLIGREGGV